MLVDMKKIFAMQFFPKLDSMYTEITGQRPNDTDPKSLVLFSTFSELCDKQTEEKIRSLFAETLDLAWTVRENRDTIPFYSQGIAVFLIYLIKRHRNRIIADWPLERNLLAAVATNIGVSLDN